MYRLGSPASIGGELFKFVFFYFFWLLVNTCLRLKWVYRSLIGRQKAKAAPKVGTARFYIFIYLKFYGLSHDATRLLVFWHYRSVLWQWG